MHKSILTFVLIAALRYTFPVPCQFAATARLHVQGYCLETMPPTCYCWLVLP